MSDALRQAQDRPFVSPFRHQRGVASGDYCQPLSQLPPAKDRGSSALERTLWDLDSDPL